MQQIKEEPASAKCVLAGGRLCGVCASLHVSENVENCSFNNFEFMCCMCACNV